MKVFYTELLKQFETLENQQKYTDAGIPKPRIIDLYNGQDFNPEYFDILTLPALYVSMRVDYAQEPPMLSLEFRLLYEQLRNTSNIGLNTTEALQFFEMANITDRIIKSIRTEHTGKIRLLSEGLELEPTITDVYVLSYECPYYGKEKTQQRETLSGVIDDVTIKTGLFKRVYD